MGTWVVKDLLEHGYDVLQGADAVIHLAAIPTAFLYQNEVTFQNNTVSTYHVLEAMAGLKIGKAVLASSETIYGIGFAKELHAPLYVPIDEEHPLLPEDCYGLSKVVGEKTAEAFHRRTGMQVASLRFGYIHTLEMFRNYPEFNHDPSQRVRNVWNYIDVRDAASACRLAMEADGLGCTSLNVVADDTCMNVKSRDLMTAMFPGVSDFREPLEGYEGLMSNRKAKTLLNWQLAHTWRSNLS